MTWNEEVRVREILTSMEADIKAPTDLKAHIMEQIMSEGAPSGIRCWLNPLFRPRTFTFTPAFGLGLVAAVAATLALWPDGARMRSVPGADPGVVATHFVLIAPEVGSVRLTGDFTSWSRQGIALNDVNGHGVWVADVELPPGVYQYVFIVDGGEWRADPGAAAQVDDGFGQVNSVVMVSPGGQSSGGGRT